MTDNTAAIARIAAEITGSIRRLSLLARATDDMGEMVAVLDALEGADGPLAALGDLFTDGAEWLQEFEACEDAQDAAERMEDTSGYPESIRGALDLVLRTIRPLA